MPSQTQIDDFAEFQKLLIGTWTNQALPGSTKGGTDDPLSYNIMPLPQKSVSPPFSEKDFPGFILKNFTYSETVRFNSNVDTQGEVALSVLAPNRDTTYQQDSRALFYSQQVHIAEGPGGSGEKGPGAASVVHVENGAWLYLYSSPQPIGPYGNQGQEPGTVVPQNPKITIAKQMSVPHGNSILALGNFDGVVMGTPKIPSASFPSPTPLPPPADSSTKIYKTLLNTDDNYQNPQLDYTADWNLPLQQAVAILKPNAYIHWKVQTEQISGVDGKGSVTNIPFESKNADVTDYSAEYWLLSTDGGANYDYLAYTQDIVMDVNIGGTKYSFPHGTANTVTRVK
jgi:hypothetical protein